MEFFVPEKLIEQRRAMQAAAAERKKVNFDPGPDMEELIRRLYGYDQSMLKAAAISLTREQTQMLAGYLPFNYYDLDEKCLFDVIRYRLDAKTCRVLYERWQEAFNNPACNDFLKTLSESEPGFMEMLAGFGIAPDSFIRVLESRSIPLSFDEELVGVHFEDGDDFNNKLRSRGVVESSLLDLGCKQALLTFCGRSDYLRCSQENLMGIIRNYDEYMLKKFLLNFLKKMSLTELQAYPELASYFRNITGPRRADSFSAFFSGAEPEYVQKYIDWINIFKLNIFFENDERSRFWKQFRFVNVIRYPVSNTLVLEFEDYVAVEFLGKEKGMVYLCEKDAFRKFFFSQLNSMSNDDIRIYFKLNKEHCLEYRNHSVRWQSHIGNLISKKNITEKVIL